MARNIACIIFFLCLSAAPAKAFAATYYVAPAGSDTNAGTQAAPFKTIGKAMNSVQPGDTVRIKPGTYPQQLDIINKHGTATAPIHIIGESADPSQYPVINGGNAGFTGADNPAFHIQNSSWLVFERLNIVNSTDASYFIDASHYIVVRRNIMDYHRHGLLLRNKSSHILMEYNDLYQSYSNGSTWTQLKGSKWEGGGFTSYGGAGMNTIRNNYFHHSFNAIYLSNDGGSRVGNYYDANVWIYRNRFEDIVDDPFEPESYALNNHFFQNTIINAHRMASFAPQSGGRGPVYVYNNLMSMTKDPTGEAASGRINSAFKIELSPNYYPQGVYVFNNSIDADYAGTNSYGNDMLSSAVYYLTEKNNVYKTLTSVYTKSSLTLNNSVFTNNMANRTFGYQEPNSYPNTDPAYANPANEDLRLSSVSPARGKSREIGSLIGFTSLPVIPAGADLGAFQYGEADFRNVPLPAYVVPPGGEDPSFPANAAWPADTEGGVNPLSGPKWLTGAVPTSPPLVKQADANTDGKTDEADYSIWLSHYGLSVLGIANGDFNGDGNVNGVDYVIWLNNYGT